MSASGDVALALNSLCSCWFEKELQNGSQTIHVTYRKTIHLTYKPGGNLYYKLKGLQRRHERRHICWLMALNLLYVFLASLACGEVSAEVAGVLGAISASEDSVLETVLGCEARGSVRP